MTIFLVSKYQALKLFLSIKCGDFLFLRGLDQCDESSSCWKDEMVIHVRMFMEGKY